MTPDMSSKKTHYFSHLWWFLNQNLKKNLNYAVRDGRSNLLAVKLQTASKLAVYNRDKQHEFKLKFNTPSIANDGKYTENS